MKNPHERIKEVFVPAPRFAENEIDTLPEASEVNDEVLGQDYAATPHPEVGELQAVKSVIKGHGEQTILPDECQYGDNDLCYVEA
jgi:hypothetical protein